jgi:PAS domain S-box-containing protein
MRSAVEQSRALIARSERRVQTSRRRCLPLFRGSSDSPHSVAGRSPSFDRLAATSDDAIISKTPQGIITSWNRAATRIFGYDPIETIGRHITMLYPRERLGEEDTLMAQIARGEPVDHFETERVRKDGARIVVAITLSPLRDPQGRIVEICHIARDITARRGLDTARYRAEQQAREGEAQRAADLAAMTRMQQISLRLVQAHDISMLLEEILDAAIAITGADMGTVQLFEGEVLKIRAQRGLEPAFLSFFDASDENQIISAAAVRAGRRVIVPDVAASPTLAGTAAREVMLAAGVRAVQSTPLLSRGGRTLGMFSTQYRAPHEPDARGLRLLDVLARQAADLIERQQAELALRGSEERFRVMADAAPVLMWMSDTDMACTWFNQQWLDFVGRTMAQEVGNGWAEGVHPEDLARCLETYRAAFRARRPFRMEYRLRRADGQYRWIADSGVPRDSVDSGFTGYIGSAIDITDMREAMDALASEIETTRALFESAAEGIVIVDAAGRIVRGNSRLAQMFGYPDGALVGQPVEILLPERFRAAHQGHRENYFAAPRPRSMGVGLDLFGLRKDGVEFPLEISLSPLHTAGEPLAMALVTDISERRSLEQAARHREKLATLATLSAGIAHELNNPIGIISSRIELMLQEATSQPLPDQVVEDLQVLHRNIQRVTTIARGLLSFARQAPDETGPVDINAVVEETLLLLGKPLARDGVQIKITLDRELGPTRGNGSALQQVLTNLLLNARDAMPRGGEVRIETGVPLDRPGWLRVSIADTGDGMTPDALARVWEPFYTTKASGTGLGLSVTQRIVREHGGAIDAHSEPGRGTTFTIVLPLQPPPRTP